MKQKLNIVKIGGNVIDHPESLNTFLRDFVAIEGPKILVHGGGKLATEMANKMGVSQVMWQGRRITDKETLKIAVMVYAGWINKTIVAQLNALGTSALGVCGADLDLIIATKRQHPEIDFGFVGDIEPASINTKAIISFVTCNPQPATALVFSPITADLTGQLLNTNADTIASTLAVALSSHFNVQLNYCFEKAGVLEEISNEASVIKKMNLTLYRKMKQEQKISNGMIPKLDTSFEAIKSGVGGIYIGHYSNIYKMINQHEDAGTAIV